MGIQHADEGCVIRVRWSEYPGYVIMQNPLDGKVYFVESKGLPRWVFERMPNSGAETFVNRKDHSAIKLTGFSHYS